MMFSLLRQNDDTQWHWWPASLRTFRLPAKSPLKKVCFFFIVPTWTGRLAMLAYPLTDPWTLGTLCALAVWSLATLVYFA